MNRALLDLTSHDGMPGPRIGAIQADRLQRLISNCVDMVRWDGAGVVTSPAVAVVVLEPAHAMRVEALVGALHENSVVILPYGENPAFDLLKAKLYSHGSLGAEGAEAPHHIWYGGVKPLALRTGVYRKESTLFISSVRQARWAGNHSANLATDMQRFGLDYVDVLSSLSGRLPQGSSKVDFIIQQWTNAARPVFWIDPQARLDGLPLLPQGLGCDFAAHRRSNGGITTGALFFHQSEAARALLDIWQSLTRSHPDLPESLLLDQAWTLAASQRQIETAWLPDDYWQTDEFRARNGAIIVGSTVQDDKALLAPYTTPLQSGRRFSRHQAPEAHLIMKGPAGGGGLITVAIRDVLAAPAREVGEAVEAATRAYATDPGDFSQMEIVLCPWNEDVNAVLQLEDYSWVLVTDPSERLQPHSFKQLSRTGSTTGQRKNEQQPSTELIGHEKSVLLSVNPSLGARLKRSGKCRRVFVRRPDLAC